MTTGRYLTVDLGATSGRVMAGTIDHAHVALRELHRFANGGVDVEGAQHWDVLALWVGIVEGLRRSAGEERGALRGIGVDAWAVDFALLDERGRLLANPRHYRDPRTLGVPERLHRRYDPDRMYAATGIQQMRINTLYQLYAMVEDDDPLLRSARTLVMIPDLFNGWLSGTFASERTVAASSQMLRHDGTWATDVLDHLGIPTALLPEVLPTGTVLGGLAPWVADQAGLDGEAPVIATACHDTASAVVATSGLEDAVFVSSGTWSLVGAELPVPILTSRARQLGFTNEPGVDGTVRFLKNIGGMWPLEQCRQQFRREGLAWDWATLLAEAQRAEPLASLIDPWREAFIQEGDMPGVVRSYCRETKQREPDSVGAIVRCCLESLALSYRRVIDQLEALTERSFGELRIVGGGSQNALLNGFVADACQRPVEAGPVEATALGNLVVQGIAVGDLESVEQGRAHIASSFPADRFEPAAGERSKERWSDAYQRFVSLLEAGS